MRLLPKSDITKQKAVVQQQTVEEGKKLAKTIDRLREVKADEEASLEKFRSETLNHIHKQTTEANSRLETLQTEVKELEERKKAALEPIKDDLTVLEERKKDLEYIENMVVTKMEELQLLMKQSDKALEDTNLKIQHIESMKILADEKFREAMELQASSLEEAEKIRLEREKIVANSELEEKRFAQRLDMLDNREERLAANEEKLEEERRLLLEERIRLDDRTATLERVLNRLKK